MNKRNTLLFDGVKYHEIEFCKLLIQQVDR